MHKQPALDPKKIILHCSASDYGDVSVIDKWHKANHWNGIGYHFVITNGHAQEPGRPYNPAHDGIVQTGRPIEDIGAHCKGENHDSIGVCVIGRHHFTAKQLYVALPETLYQLCFKYDIPATEIHPHNLFDKGKTCPNIPPAAFQVVVDMVEARLNAQ